VTREQKIAKARELRQEGLSWGAIGGQLGVSRDQARYYATRAVIHHDRRQCSRCGADFTPKHGRTKFCGQNCRAAAENERKRRSAQTTGRALCSDCGEPLSEGSRWRRHARCFDCHASNVSRPVDTRGQQIERWWNDTIREIAGRLGWSLSHAAQEIHRLRAKGFKLPYRQAAGPSGERRFPEQVAA
jgi:hypothetical protein